MDESNTNQNEATSTNVILTCESNALVTNNFQNMASYNDQPTDKTDSFSETIPTIIVTPASPNKNGSKDSSGEVLNSSTGFGNTVTLGIPPFDKCMRESRPPLIEFDPLKCSMNNSNDDDLEGIYRCSSTPKKHMINCDDGNCSISFNEDGSPIVSTDGIVVETCNNTSQLDINTDPADNGKADMNIKTQTDHPIPNINMPYLSSHVHTIQNNFEASRSPTLLPVHTQSQALDITHGMTSLHQNMRQPENEQITCMSGDVLQQPSYNQACMRYGDCCPSSDNSWTDMSCGSVEMSPVPTLQAKFSTDNFNYPMSIAGPTCAIPDADCFVYPSIYVSSAGLISVLLKNDMSVEMTVDRTIRVVSHHHMMAVATDSRGTAACIYHPAVKVFQVGTTTDIATEKFRARMGGGDTIVFSNGLHYFKLEDSELQPTPPIKFSDIGRDQSVNLLFSSEGYGESLVPSCMQVASQAEYANLPKGGIIVRINGVKVTQTGNGDVSVVTGAKFIRLSPYSGTTRLGNRFIDIEVEKDWTVKLTRGSHNFISNRKQSMVCNGKMEAGFDENNGLKVANLMPRHPLLTDVGMARRQIRKPSRFLWPSSSNPKRKSDSSPMGRGGRNF